MREGVYSKDWNYYQEKKTKVGKVKLQIERERERERESLDVIRLDKSYDLL